MTMLNEHLEHYINQKLLSNDDLSSQRIDVVANGGVVTLSGEVQSYRRKLVAHEIVASCDEVAELKNEITVASSEIEDDSALTEQVNSLLDADTDIVNESICVSAKTGVVSLTGYVSTELEKTRAADIAAAVPGVLEIANFLIANPDEVASNRIHCQKVLDAITGVIGMEDENIRLAVVNEVARLSGTVDEAWKRASAEEVVRQFGILTVSNEIIVST